MGGWFRKPRDSGSPAVSATDGGLAVGRDLLNSQVTTGLDEADVEERLRRVLDEKLAGIAQIKGVPEAPLRAVLQKLGEAEIPTAEIPACLAAAADELIQLRQELTRLRHDRPEFAEIRAKALALIYQGEFDAAHAVLNEGRVAARALREELSRSEAAFLVDEARVYRLQLNYAAACEKLAEAGALDRENCLIWIDLGDLWMLRGSFVEAEKAFQAALKAAAAGTDERDLSVSHNKLGGVQVAQGDLLGALRSYQASHTTSARGGRRRSRATRGGSATCRFRTIGWAVCRWRRAI